MEVSDYIQQLQVLQDKNGSVEVIILDKENDKLFTLNEIVFSIDRGSVIVISIGNDQIGVIPGPPPDGMAYLNRIESGSTGNRTPEEIIAELKERARVEVPPVTPLVER